MGVRMCAGRTSGCGPELQARHRAGATGDTSWVHPRPALRAPRCGRAVGFASASSYGKLIRRTVEPD
jgi:hypothetical protein